MAVALGRRRQLGVVGLDPEPPSPLSSERLGVNDAEYSQSLHYSPYQRLSGGI